MALETGLVGCTLLGLGLGGWSIYWARSRAGTTWAVLGRRLFLLTILMMGLLAVPAAYYQTQQLTPLGIALGLLLVAMLWEVPEEE